MGRTEELIKKRRQEIAAQPTTGLVGGAREQVSTALGDLRSSGGLVGAAVRAVSDGGRLVNRGLGAVKSFLETKTPADTEKAPAAASGDLTGAWLSPRVARDKENARPLALQGALDKADRGIEELEGRREQLAGLEKNLSNVVAGWARPYQRDLQSQIQELDRELSDARAGRYGYARDLSELGVAVPEAPAAEREPEAVDYINRALDLGGDAVMSGVSQFVTGAANTADLLAGKPLVALGWRNNPLRAGAKIMNEYNDQLSQRLAQSAGESAGAQTAAKLLSSAVAAAPMAVMAYLTGGASLASTGALETQAASQGMSAGQMVGQAVSQMMRDPGYWTAFIQEAGNNYHEAQEWAKDDDTAAMYALTAGLINAGIEVGLDGASGIQGLERSVREGNTTGLREFFRSAGGEGMEEIKQGLVSRGLGQLFGSGARTFSMTDSGAVVNPRTMAEEGAMGAAVGALLSGGTYAVDSAINSAMNRRAPEGRSDGAAQTEVEDRPGGQKNSAPEGTGNVRITDSDEYEYMNTGSRPQIKAAKQTAVNTGEKIVLTSVDETRDYIREAISGATKGVIPKAYGKVGSAMADDIYAVSSGAFDVEGWYLELVPSDLRHAFVQHSNAKQSGNISLTEEDFLSIPDYIDTYDDVLECKTFSNGEREIILGKKINGYSVIVEIVSRSRKSLSFKNMWGVDTPTYEAKYKNSGEYRPSRSSKKANDSKGMHNTAVLDTTVPQSSPDVNPESAGREAADVGNKGTPETDTNSIPAALNGSTGIDESGFRGPEDSLTPGQRYVKSVVDDAFGKSKNGRVDISDILQKLSDRADTNPEATQDIVDGYNALFTDGDYAVDAVGRLYKAGGETDLSIDQRQDDLYILGKRQINAFQFDHPEVHQYYVEAARGLLADLRSTVKGERFFNFNTEYGGSPIVTGVKRNTTAPIEHMLDDYHMTYERIEDVLNRIINDKGQENIADAKRVEMILDDILKNGYTDIEGYQVAPNEGYLATLRKMGQLAEEETTEPASGEDRYVQENRLSIDTGLATEEEIRQEYRRDHGPAEGQNNPASGTEESSGFRNIGAAERGFTTPDRGETVYSQNRTMTEGVGLTEEERQRFTPGVHERVTGEMSRERAGGLFYEDENGDVVDIEDTVDGLLEKDAWTGVEQDAAQMAFRYMKDRLSELTTEQYSSFQALARAIEEIGGTEAGRSLQARQKWVESGDGIVSKSMSILDDPRIDPTAARGVMGHVAELAGRYDDAVKSGDMDALFQIIREAAQERRTSKTRENGEIKRTAEWAMEQIKSRGDVEFAENAARSSIIAMAQDYVPQSKTARLKAFRRDAMLSKISTWARNVVSNNVFDPIDSIARDISVPIDMLLSKVTKTRSVNWDASWLSKAKREGTRYGLARSFLEVSLDISAEGAESKYGQAGNRTFKMSGGLFSRFMSQWEKISNYAMYSTDQMQKGGIQSEVQRGIDRLYEEGRISDESLRDAGAQEAAFRTFQEDSAISKGLSAIRRGFNQIAHVGELGLGDILMPFVQVPANLVDITIDYSPLGLARGLYRLTDTLIDARRGNMTASQQARAVETLGRSLTGTAVLALAVVAKMGGALILSDDGRDEDKDKSALESQANLSGTQLNLSGLKRLLTGGSAKKQPGDVLMSIEFMDPLNALLNMGGLIADDYIAEHEGEKNGITFGEIVGDAAAGVTQSVMELPMMSPFAEAAQAYQYSGADTEGGRWLDAAKQYAAGQVTSVIPNIVKGIAQGTDTKKRDLYSGETLGRQTLDSVKAGIPILRQQLPVKQNSFGEEMGTGDPVLNFLNNNILPGTITQYTPQNPVISQWLDDLYDTTGAVTQYPDKKPPNSVSKDTDGDGKAEKFALNAEEKRQYQRTYGSIYEELVGQLTGTGEAFSPEDILESSPGSSPMLALRQRRSFTRGAT